MFMVYSVTMVTFKVRSPPRPPFFLKLKTEKKALQEFLVPEAFIYLSVWIKLLMWEIPALNVAQSKFCGDGTLFNLP